VSSSVHIDCSPNTKTRDKCNPFTCPLYHRGDNVSSSVHIVTVVTGIMFLCLLILDCVTVALC
jgi:hypothetical protein